MKKTLIIAVLLFSFLNVIIAQENWKMKKDNQDQKMQQGNKKGHDREKMAKLLQLTEDQKKQFQQIRKENKIKMDLLDEQQSITVKEYNDRKTILRKEMQSKRESILTKQQKDRIATAKELRELKKREMFVKRMGMMKEKLNLTEEQVKQLSTLDEKNKLAVDKIKNDSKLNDQEKRMKIKTVIASSKELRKKILTAEQLDTLEKMQKNKKKYKENN